MFSCEFCEFSKDIFFHRTPPVADNDTPLHDAVSNNRIEVVQLLLERGAQVTIRSVNFIITRCSPRLKVVNCC